MTTVSKILLACIILFELTCTNCFICAKKQKEAFDLELLVKVDEVKDTTRKRPLTLHIVRLMIEKFPDSTDLFSELPHVHRVAAKVIESELDLTKYILLDNLLTV